MKSILTQPIPEIAITITIAIIGSLVWLLVFINHFEANSSSLIDTFNSIATTPFLIFAFFLWLKALYIDYMRIKSSQKAKMPFSAYYFAFIELITIYVLVSLFPDQTNLQWWFGIIWIAVNMLFFKLLPKLHIKRPTEFKDLSPFEVNLFKAYLVTITVYTILVFALSSTS